MDEVLLPSLEDLEDSWEWMRQPSDGFSKFTGVYSLIQ